MVTCQGMALDTLQARGRTLALYERYGPLLTEHQRAVMDLYLRSDWSLAEVAAGLREVRLALLEADVNFGVVKEFVERVRARLVGTEISPGLTAPQAVIKAVDDELGELLGGNAEGVRYASHPPTVLMLV